LARALEQHAAPGLNLLESEVKRILFADDLVLGLRFCQTWALTVNLSKTKITVFQKKVQFPGPQIQITSRLLNDLNVNVNVDTVALEHTKNYTYLGLNISTTGNFHKAVNDLRDKARRAFYVNKWKIKFDIPIRIWL
jgi:hypothetical protein